MGQRVRGTVGLEMLVSRILAPTFASCPRFFSSAPKEAEVVHRLLYATYYPTEPLISHLGLCKGLNSIADLDKVVEERLASNLTLVAFDETGRPVGAAVNNVCNKHEVGVELEEELKEVE